ncbi:MAG: PAS domain S-box protein, partial [Bacteroidales bacterium]|nr:PAS domain S-box protein [Bacteroidales bacterium]
LKFEQFSEPMGKWYSVLAYSPKEKYFATIFRDITKQKKSEQALLKAKEKAEEKEWEQKERVKELQGIISLGRLEEKYEEPDDIYTEFVNKVVPESMQFPDKVFISLKVNNQTYSNNKQTKSKNYLSAPIFVSKKQIGQLTVTYVDDSPFIEIFEQNIINAYAERLSKITERITAKKELEKQSLFVNTLLDNLKVGVVACDTDGKLTYFNKTTQEFHGLPQKEIGSENWAEYYDLYLPDGKTKMQTKDIPLFRALEGEQFNNVEMMIIPNQGKSYTLAASGSTMFDADGKKQGAVVSMYDISERKKVKQALKESEEKYRLITENVSDVIWIFNVTRNKFTYTSPSVFKLTGYAAKESVHQSIKEKYSSESGKRAEEIIRIETRKFIKNPNINDIQVNNFQQFCKNGSLIWIETSTKFHYNSANEIEIVGITRNIEDRKKAEQALKESEEKYRLITQNASDVIWILNVSQNKFTFISPSEIKTTGFTDKESVKQSVEEKFPIEFAKKAKEIIGIETQKFIKNPNSNDIQVNNFQQKCKDG